MNYVDFFANVFLHDVLKAETLAGIHKFSYELSRERSGARRDGSHLQVSGGKRGERARGHRAFRRTEEAFSPAVKHPADQIHVVPRGSFKTQSTTRW